MNGAEGRIDVDGQVISYPINGVAVTTMPVKSPETLSGQRDRVYYYDYEHGREMFLSKRERILLDAWLLSHNYFECVRRLKEETGVEISPMTAMRWLKRPHVVARLNKEMKAKAEANNLTRDEWLAQGVRMQREDGKVGFHKLVAWKELGRACGFYEESNLINNQVSISFTQADGRV